MKRNPTKSSSQFHFPAQNWLLVLLLTFVSIICVDFSNSRLSHSDAPAFAQETSSLPFHSENDLPQLHRDAVPPLISQLTNGNPICARILSRNHVSTSSFVRELIHKNLIYNKFHNQQKSFRTHIAQWVANGAHTYRCGVLII